MSDNIGVIFDCDGVLLDSMGFWHAYDDRLADLVGVEFTEEDRDHLTASTIYECGVYMHEKYGIATSAQEIVDMIDSDMYDFYSAEVRPKPGALEFVRGLANEGIAMSVASSTPPRLLRKGLEVAGFVPYMRAIVSVDDIASSKREPLVYDTAREPLGTDRAHTWGIEDALYAIKTLKRANYKTLAVFDSEIAGKPAQLMRAADLFAYSFEEMKAQDFLDRTQALIGG